MSDNTMVELVLLYEVDETPVSYAKQINVGQLTALIGVVDDLEGDPDLRPTTTQK